MKDIQLRDAKASLSAVIDEAMRGRPRSSPDMASGRPWSLSDEEARAIISRSVVSAGC